ncbi:MAG: hypothetical protein JXM73_20215 [Anaerolineae bacterium]|nr:hypothetical protein [Anaerolineae bacterium]
MICAEAVTPSRAFTVAGVTPGVSSGGLTIWVIVLPGSASPAIHARQDVTVIGTGLHTATGRQDC